MACVEIDWVLGLLATIGFATISTGLAFPVVVLTLAEVPRRRQAHAAQGDYERKAMQELAMAAFGRDDGDSRSRKFGIPSSNVTIARV